MEEAGRPNVKRQRLASETVVLPPAPGATLPHAYKLRGVCVPWRPAPSPTAAAAAGIVNEICAMAGTASAPEILQSHPHILTFRADSESAGAPIQVLLTECMGRPGADVWTFPGGSLDPGEDVAICARRETQEESGAVGALGCYLGLFEVLARALARPRSGAPQQ